MADELSWLAAELTNIDADAEREEDDTEMVDAGTPLVPVVVAPVVAELPASGMVSMTVDVKPAVSLPASVSWLPMLHRRSLLL